MQSPSPALDPVAIAELRGMAGDEPSLILQIIECYLEEAPSLMAEMREGILRQDGVALVRSAHSLKSSSQALGAVGVAEICLKLEQIGRSSHLAERREEIAAVMAQLEPEYDRVKAALHQECDRL